MKYFPICLALLLSACDGGPRESLYTGSASAHRLTEDTYRIEARGNAHTNASTVQDFIMLRAAETTKVHGGTHFILISTGDASSRHAIAHYGRSTGYAVAHTITQPGIDAFIRVVRVPATASPPPGAFSADDVIRHTGERIRAKEAPVVRKTGVSPHAT